MEPLTIIMAALVGGAAAAAKDVGTQVVKDAYGGLKSLVLRKFGKKADLASALELAEKESDSKPRRAVLEEELAKAGADQDNELVQQAQALIDLLNKYGARPVENYTASLSGSGAIAQDHSTAAGEGGVAVGGNVQGGVSVGTRLNQDK